MVRSQPLSIFLCAWVLCVTSTPAARAQEKESLAALDFRQVIRESKGKVFPAVVYIKVIHESFEAGKRRSEEASGSGVLLNDSGEVLTNWHVVDKAKNVRCLLFDGRAFDAAIVGTDKDLDIALVQLKLKEGEKTPFATLGDSAKLQEGDFVMAMGAPWGLSRSVSIGIISCTRRYLPAASEYSHWLQTDASISPGNSGGPLVSTDGHVVAINTRGVNFGGDIGFSLPVHILAQVLPHLRSFGEVRWAYTGLQLQALHDFDRNMYFEGTEGVLVAGTDPESPARRAGILERDLILRVNGQSLTALTEEDLPDVRRTLGLLPLDKPMQLDIRRQGQSITVSLIPRAKGRVEGDELDFPRWDFTAKAINQFDNPDLHFHRQVGVFVFGIKQPGNAANVGLRERDILLKVDGQDVQTLEQLKAAHESAIQAERTKSKVTLTILRNGIQRQIVLDYRRDYERE